jgi:hypothetical protein
MLVTMLTGCALFGKNTAKYRALPVLNVGNEEITLGRVIDLFNTYYSSYAQYIQAGYYTYEDVLDMTLDAIYSTYIKVDAYKTAQDVVTYTAAENKYVDEYQDAKYLSQEEMEILVKSVKYSLFAGLDSYVQNFIAIEVGDIHESHEQASRDFVEHDDMMGCATYAEMLYLSNLKDKEADEYFEKFPLATVLEATLEDYVLEVGQAQARVDDVNERLAEYVEDHGEEGDEIPSITEEQYVTYQERALRQYTKSIDANYGFTPAELFVYQVESYIDSVIAMKYDLKVSSTIETSATFKQEVEATFNSNVATDTANYALNPSNFESFVSSLTNDSVIYSVPSQYADSYIFVKNLLIPFSEKQTAILNNYAAVCGSNTSDEYVAFRTQLAAQIVAKDFNNDEAEVEGVFEYVGGEIKLAGALAQELPNGGTVTNEKFMELMLQYNTDTASHANVYDYVVRVGYTPSSFNHSWVPEFVDAANVAYEAGIGHYAIAVSNYGVHVVMYSGNVEAASFDVNKIYDTASNEYRVMKQAYSDKLAYLQRKDNEQLDETYKYAADRKIQTTANFKQLLKILEIEYDFEAAMTKPE